MKDYIKEMSDVAATLQGVDDLAKLTPILNEMREVKVDELTYNSAMSIVFKYGISLSIKEQGKTIGGPIDMIDQGRIWKHIPDMERNY